MINTNLLELIDSVEVVSFDIFDTAIFRKIDQPKDVFELMIKNYEAQKGSKLNFDFYNFRIEAENIARKIKYSEGIKEDITIDEIYNFLTKEYKISHRIAEKLKLLEIATEIDICVVNPYIFEVYQYCKKKSKKIIFCSEMYLTQEIIRKILVKTGYTVDQIFVSSSVKKSKVTGNIYKSVLNSISYAANEILHIGDNYYSDIEVPSKLGFKTYYYQKLKSDIELNTKNLEWKIYQGLKTNYLNQYNFIEKDETNFWRQLGYCNLGILYFGFVQWLVDEIISNDIELVCFAAREGMLLQSIYEKFRVINPNLPESIYLYASRRLYYPTSQKIFNEELCDFLVAGPVGGIVAEYIERIGLEPYNYAAKLRDFGFEKLSDVVQEQSDIENLKNFFWTIKEDVVKCFSSENDILIDYFQSCGLFKYKRIGFVDIGWNGSIQQAFVNLIKEKWNNVNIFGYYLATYSGAKKKVSDGLRMSGFLLNAGEPGEWYKIIGSGTEVFEIFTSACHGTITGLAKNKHGITPILKQDKDIHVDNKIYYLHEGVLLLADDLLKINRSFPFVKIDKNLAFNDMKRLITNPTIEEAIYVGNLPFVSGWGETKLTIPIAKPSSDQLIYNKKKLLKEINSSWWKAAFYKRLERIETRQNLLNCIINSYKDLLKKVYPEKYIVLGKLEDLTVWRKFICQLNFPYKKIFTDCCYEKINNDESVENNNNILIITENFAIKANSLINTDISYLLKDIKLFNSLFEYEYEYIKEIILKDKKVLSIPNVYRDVNTKENYLLSNNLYIIHLIDNIIKKTEGKKVYLFGTGSTSNNLNILFYYLNNLKIAHVNICGYFDNDCTKWGGEIENKPIYNPRKLQECEMKNNAYIIIASQYYREISKQLAECNFNMNQIINGFELDSEIESLMQKNGGTGNLKIDDQVLQNFLNEIQRHLLKCDSLNEGTTASIIEKKITKHSKNLIVFGAGDTSTIFSKYIASKFNKKIEIEYYVDNNPEKWGTLSEFNGKPILKPNVLLEKSKEDCYIIICSKFYKSIAEQLDMMGFKENINYCLVYNECKIVDSYSTIDNITSIFSNKIEINMNDNEIVVLNTKDQLFQLIFCSFISSLYNKEFVIWGADNAGSDLLLLLQTWLSFNSNFLFFIDDDVDKWGSKYQGFEVLRPEILDKAFSNSLILTKEERKGQCINISLFTTIANYLDRLYKIKTSNKSLSKFSLEIYDLLSKHNIYDVFNSFYIEARKILNSNMMEKKLIVYGQDNELILLVDFLKWFEITREDQITMFDEQKSHKDDFIELLEDDNVVLIANDDYSILTSNIKKKLENTNGKKVIFLDGKALNNYIRELFKIGLFDLLDNPTFTDGNKEIGLDIISGR